jgi:hypothetical protein
VIGITIPGYNTVFRKGRIGKVSGTGSFFKLSAFSGEKTGIKSVSVSINSAKFNKFFIKIIYIICE